MQTVSQSWGSNVALTVTNLLSLASSATAGWQSDRVDLRSATVLDVEVFVKLVTANTAPANDKAAYVYLVPWYNDGTSWFAGDQGTTTLPTGTEGTTTIANPPSGLVLLGTMNYTTQQQIMQKTFFFSNAFEQMPDGFSIIIVNFSGAALTSSGSVVNHKVLAQTIN